MIYDAHSHDENLILGQLLIGGLVITLNLFFVVLNAKK